MAQDLRQKCCQFASGADLRVLEAWRRDADALLTEGDENGCAVLLVCLADVYRDLGKFGAAIECSAKAELYFRVWNEIQHRHNHAVAAYCTGLAHQFSGSDRSALRKYDEALERFSVARTDWMLMGEDRWRKQCELAGRWIERLRNRLRQAYSGGVAPTRTQVPVPVLSSISAGQPMLAAEDFSEWVNVEVSQADRINFVLRVKGDSMTGAGISDGDLVLIEQTSAPPPNGQIAAVLVEGVDPEATLKKFYQEPDHIRLEPANANYPLIIVKPNRVPEADIRARYNVSHPKRLLEIHSGVEARIVGWYRGLV
jgi:SOS-response transcriptional repressor LexA